MLVQLRRVVYLLVLLQFCLSVCLANGGGSGTNEEERKVAGEETTLRASVGEAYHLLVRGRGCLIVLEELKEKDEKHLRVPTDADKIDERVNGIQKALGEPGNAGVQDQHKEEEMRKVVQGPMGAMRETMKAVEAKATALDKTKIARSACKVSIDDVGLEASRLKDNWEHFSAPLKRVAKFATPEREKLDKNITATVRELSALNKKLDEIVKREDEPMTSAGEQLRSAQKTMETAISALESIAKEDPRVKNTWNTFRGEVEGLKNEIKKVKEKVAASIGRAEVSLDQLLNTPATATRDTAMDIMRDKLKKAMEAAALQMEREREVNRQTPAGGKVQEERKEEAGVSEGKKKKPEEDKASVPGRAAVKEASEESEKEEEEEETVAEKGKKKKDGSVSPALVHSSLVLLLLCVLGSILVC